MCQGGGHRGGQVIFLYLYLWSIYEHALTTYHIDYNYVYL